MRRSTRSNTRSASQTRGGFNCSTKLGQFVALARSFGLFSALFTDGSFATDKDLPGDIDAVLELPRASLKALLAATNFHQLDPAAVKATYEVHLFFQQPPPAPGLDWVLFFQRLKPEEAIVRKLSPSTMRGILKVSL